MVRSRTLALLWLCPWAAERFLSRRLMDRDKCLYRTFIKYIRLYHLVYRLTGGSQKNTLYVGYKD